MGSQLGASQRKCGIFPKAAGGLLAVVEHNLQKEFTTIASHFAPLAPAGGSLSWYTMNGEYDSGRLEGRCVGWSSDT